MSTVMNTRLPPHTAHAGHPYLFAYDIRDPKRARPIRQCLQRWRVDGQYSVHETRLRDLQVQELTVELLDLVDPATDRLLVARLSQRGAGAVHVLSRSPKRAPFIYEPPVPLPARPADGWYLLAYDITDPPRLHKVQRITARRSTYLQRSVYLYHGNGAGLRDLLDELGDTINRQFDDLRVYRLSAPRDLWFPCGPVPPLAGFAAEPEGLWRRLQLWLGSA